MGAFPRDPDSILRPAKDLRQPRPTLHHKMSPRVSSRGLMSHDALEKLGSGLYVATCPSTRRRSCQGRNLPENSIHQAVAFLSYSGDGILHELDASPIYTMPKRQRLKASNIPFPECSMEAIANAQTKPRIILDNISYDRIPFTSKTLPPVRKCPGCGVMPDQFHVVPCPHEKCPRCRCLLLNCECFLE
jgi:hypothetical protein